MTTINAKIKILRGLLANRPVTGVDGELFFAKDTKVIYVWDALDSSWNVTGGVANWDDIIGKPSTFPPTLPIAEASVTGLVADLATLAGAIVSEASTRSTADSTLQAHIDSEASTRAAAVTAAVSTSEGYTDAAISTEVTNRNTAIATEATARASADTTLQTNITNEASARASAVTAAIATAEGYTDSSIATEVAARNTAIGVETTNRTTADTTLQTNITSEATARAAADTAAIATAEAYTDSSIASEVSNRNTAINAAIATEVTNRNAAITVAVAGEATNRTNADNTLQTNITAEATTRASADTTLQTNITSEASTRAAADTAAIATAEGYTDTKVAALATVARTGAYADLTGTPTAAYAANLGDGSTTDFTVTHNLGTTDVIVQVHELSSGNEVTPVEIKITSTTAIHVVFAVAPSSNDYRVVILTASAVNYVPSGLPTGIATQYVNTSTGNDTTGNGSSGSPWKTIGKALSTLPQIIEQNYVINVADGTYAEAIAITNKTSAGTGTISLVGNSATPANVVLTGTYSYPANNRIAAGTATVFVDGRVNVSMVGFRTLATANDRDILARNNASLSLQNVRASSPSSYGFSALDGVFLQITDNITSDAATVVGMQILWGSRVACLATTTGTALTLTGPSSVTVYWGLHVAYSSQIVSLTNNFNVAISNVFIGIAMGIASCVQFYTAPGTLTITNATTPSGSQAVLGTDQSTMSSRLTTTFTHFTIGVNLNSLAYFEHDSTTGTSYTLTSVGTASATSTGAVYNIF